MKNQKLIELKNPFKAAKEAFAGLTGEVKEEFNAMGELCLLYTSPSPRD